jgi:hypothetical protein
MAPVRKQPLNQSPNVNVKKLYPKRDANFKSPSIVTLKLPEIENKPMYATVKDPKGFKIDSYVKDEVVKSMIDNRKLLEAQEEKPETERKLETIPIRKPVSNAHTNLLRDVRNI